MSRGKATVYRARKVRTMDPGRPEAQAVAALEAQLDACRVDVQESI